MKKLNSKVNFLCFLVTICALAFVTPSCGDLEESVVTPEETLDDEINGYATDKISHTHVIGGDPCPQSVASRIKVFCYKTQDQSDCTADSVVITNISAGLTASFGGNLYATFGASSEIREIELKFTCAVAESFKHSYTLVFYKDGVKVDEEDAVVDVTVK